MASNDTMEARLERLEAAVSRLHDDVRHVRLARRFGALEREVGALREALQRRSSAAPDPSTRDFEHYFQTLCIRAGLMRYVCVVAVVCACGHVNTIGFHWLR